MPIIYNTNIFQAQPPLHPITYMETQAASSLAKKLAKLATSSG